MPAYTAGWKVLTWPPASAGVAVRSLIAAGLDALGGERLAGAVGRMQLDA